MDVLLIVLTVVAFAAMWAFVTRDGARMNLADVLELILAVALLVYLSFALIRPERF